MDRVQRDYLDLVRSLQGTTIVGKRLFLDTLQLYLSVDDTYDPETAFEIWCENPWQLLDSEGVLADSQTIQHDGTWEEMDAAQKELSRITEILRSRRIEDIKFDRKTQGLIILLWGLEIRTFPTDSSDDEQWRLRGPNGKPDVGGCEDGIYDATRDSEDRET